MDDSCGTLDTLRRTEVRVFRDGRDVTEEFGDPSLVVGDAEVLFNIMQKIASK